MNEQTDRQTDKRSGGILLLQRPKAKNFNTALHCTAQTYCDSVLCLY